VIGARLTYWAYLGVCWGVRRLPLGVLIPLGRAIGRMGWVLSGGYRRLVLRNLDVAFEGQLTREEASALGREHFARLVSNLLAGVRLSGMDWEAVMERVDVEGIEGLREARGSGRGFVGVIGHFGNWELLAQLLPRLFGGEVGSVYQRLGNPFIDRSMLEQRRKFGLHLFSRKQGFFWALELLGRGGGVGVLADQHSGDGGVWIPFFGRLASSSPLPAMLAIRSGAPLISIAMETLPGGRWRLRIGKPEEPVSANSEEVSLQVNRMVEAQIRSAPEDWLWAHNRWKTPKPRFLLSRTKRALRAEGMTSKFRLLIRATNWLGDAVMTVPAVRSMARARPDLEVCVLTPAKLADFWRRIPEVSRVLEIREGAGILEVARQLREERWDAAVLFPNSVRVALEVWLGGVPRRVGYRGHWRRWFIDQVFPGPSPRKGGLEHQVHHYLRLAEFVGAQALPVSEWALARGAEPDRLVSGGVRRLGVCAGAEYGPAKRWLPERFAGVMRRVSERYRCEWHLLGVGKDAEIGRQIEEGVSGLEVRNRIGRTSLEELMGVLQELDLLLTNDTGTMHLAAILGVPVVAVFGSTEPLATGPLGEGHRWIRHSVPCGPCFRRECPLDFACMQRVSVEEVAEAVEAALAGFAPTGV
jgi:heptosyltransferase-2